MLRMTPDNEVSQLPSHTVRVSKRTQHVHLKITVAKGLEVILPKGMDRTSVPWILRANENWIARQLKRVEEQRKNVPGNLAAVSSQLKLRATGELWRISYLTFAAKTKLIERAGRELVLNCSPSDTATVRVLLEEWLRGRAREYLMPWLRRLSGEFRLPYARARIKSQQTLWASCSSKRAINLNYKLVFLQPELVRYVLIHELCHTAHLDHSARFWSLVKSIEPDHERLEIQLKTASQWVPLWLEL